MTLEEIFFPGGRKRVLRLNSRNLAGVLREMVDALCLTGRLPMESSSAALKALIDREEISSTGIGDGVAIPHARVDVVPDIVGLIAISKEGIDFKAIDGQPVFVVLLVLSPKGGSADASRPGSSPSGSPSAHLNTLANISQFIRSEKFRAFMGRVRENDSDYEDFT